VCSALRTCAFDNEYESAAPTGWSTAPYVPWQTNRVCTALTTCTFASQYESTAKTNTSDRKCTALTTCTDAQYESVKETQTTDRECTAHTTCTSTQWQTKAHGTHHDRECKDCVGEPACPWNQYRKGCGGLSAGVCAYDCDDEHNCFVGRSGTNWFGAATQWSKHSFPTWPQQVRVASAVGLRKVARGAAKKTGDRQRRAPHDSQPQRAAGGQHPMPCK
jgi:hypothetical protein